MIDIQLQQFFMLEDYDDLFKQAVTPKSCGGNDGFGFLALLGDNLLNLGIYDFFSEEGIIDSSILSEKKKSIHNEWTLCKLGEFLNITKLMNPRDSNHEIQDSELKESVEALIGANYKARGFANYKEVVQRLLRLVKENGLYDSNPKGTLINYFHKYRKNFKFPECEEVVNSSNEKGYICKINEEFQGKRYNIVSNIFNRKTYAKKDAAQKFLIELGLCDGSNAGTILSIKGDKIKLSLKKTSLTSEKIEFIKELAHESKQFDLETGTGELYLDYAHRKIEEENVPFKTLLILSACLCDIKCSFWKTNSLPDEFIIMNMILGENKYFELGVGTSKTKAKDEAAKKIIKNSNFFEWLEKNHCKDKI